MYYSSMAILALIIHFIINYDVLKKGGDGDAIPAHKSYRYFLNGVTIFYIADALWGILYGIKLLWPIYVDTIAYFIAMAVAVFLWTKYVIDYLNRDNPAFSRLLFHVGWAFLAFEAVMLLLNFVTPVLFWFDENGEYHAESGRYLTLLIQIILFFATSIYTLLVTARTKGKMKFRHRAIGIFGIAMICLIIVQTFYPLLPLYSLGYLLGTCLLHTFVLEDEKDARRKELEELLEREKRHKAELGSARHMAYTDSLTGVKSKHAYVEAEIELDQRIAEGTLKELGVAVFGLNGLKEITDAMGHEKGDQCIKEASELISKVFNHCPIFRIGGDEFVAFLEEENYRNRDALMSFLEKKVGEKKKKGQMTISFALEEFHPGEDKSYSVVFERADRKMYAYRKRFGRK